MPTLIEICRIGGVEIAFLILCNLNGEPLICGEQNTASKALLLHPIKHREWAFDASAPCAIQQTPALLLPAPAPVLISLLPSSFILLFDLWIIDDNNFSRSFHARLPKGHDRTVYVPILGTVRSYNLANIVSIVLAQASLKAGLFGERKI
jgi:hypothetical protein